MNKTILVKNRGEFEALENGENGVTQEFLDHCKMTLDEYAEDNATNTACFNTQYCKHLHNCIECYRTRFSSGCEQCMQCSYCENIKTAYECSHRVNEEGVVLNNVMSK